MDLEAETRPSPPGPALPAVDVAARLPALRARLYAAAFLVDLLNYAYPVCVTAYAQGQLGARPFVLGCLGTTSTAVKEYRQWKRYMVQ